MSRFPAASPSPFVAGLLSCLCTGLGQVHCGRAWRGLALWLASVSFLPLALTSTDPSPSVPVLVTLAMAAGSVLATLASIIDAARLARRPGRACGPRPAALAGLLIVGLALPVGVADWIRNDVVQVYQIAAASMVPTLRSGDRVVADKSRQAVSSARRGDLIVFPWPDHPGQCFVKRVVALPGERVAVRRGQLSVNGLRLARIEVPGQLVRPPAQGTLAIEAIANRAWYTISTPDHHRADTPETTVAPGTCWVLGDNRDNSFDSRDFGPVLLADIQGVVVSVFDPTRPFDGLQAPDAGIPADYLRMIRR